MSSDDGRPAAQDEVLTLIQELLEAHADTIQLGSAGNTSRGGIRPGSRDIQTLRLRAHLDYLRALQRKGQEILARSERFATTHSARTGLR